MHACERHTPIKDTYLWDMYVCERRTPIRDTCLREMHNEFPVLQAILEGGEDFYMAQSGKRADLLVSARGGWNNVYWISYDRRGGKDIR
jgi:hypothetical protein